VIWPAPPRPLLSTNSSLASHNKNLEEKLEQLKAEVGILCERFLVADKKEQDANKRASDHSV